MEIPIDQYGYSETKLYEYDSVCLEPGVIFLVGCNGSGKTTIMHQIEKYVKHSDDLSNVAVIFFKCNESMNVVNETFMTGSDIELGATILSSSEGERMSMALTRAFNRMWDQCKNSKIHSVIFMLDSLDSGVDIPTLRMIRGVLDETINIAKDEFDTELYILVSANDYALVENRKCLDVRTGKTLIFHSWTDYAEFCEESNKFKQDRYSEDSL